jgi:hypothetical protein
VQVYRDADKPVRGAALRASLKLPTGNSSELHGSGSTDFALWLTASDCFSLGKTDLTVFGAAGGMVMSEGDVLPDRQRELLGFGTLGVGWGPLEWLALKTQLNGHTPFYSHSSLRELSVSSVQWLIGGSVALSDRTSLDMGVAEDLLILSASHDFGVHLALRTMF